MRKIGLAFITPSTYNISEILKDIIKINEFKGVMYTCDTSINCDPQDFINTEYLNSKYILFLSSKLNTYDKNIIGLQVIDNNFKQEDIGLFSAISTKNLILISTIYIKSDNIEIMKHRIVVTILHELGEIFARLLGYTHFTLVFAKHVGECVFHPRDKQLFDWIRNGNYRFVAKYKDSLPEYYCSRCSDIIKEGLELWQVT